MNIRTSEIGQVRVITVSGSIDALTAGDVEAVLVDQAANGHSRLVIDMSQVEFMSSAGLRMILTGLKACRQAGGDLRIAAAQPGVANILNIAGFTSVLKIYDQIELAVSSFGEN